MDLTALYKFSYGLYVIGVKHGDKLGGCIVDALVQASSDDPPTLILCSIKGNYTNELIKSSGAFSISVLPVTVDPFVVANFGFQSARVADKWANVPHTIVDGLPQIEGAASYVRCKVKDTVELATHSAFFSVVTDAVCGDGEPLIFGNYQKTMKKAAYDAFQKFKESGTPPARGDKWQCSVCGHVYEGDTPFEDLPGDWTCPLCGVGKDKFEKM
ncbi:MAG: flavin reductase [Synergistaceae bacterium]|jgi:flavin reductase (DIM6/NTAB) family NADH-FMN oxidoreductase RutF/rubredoxin|nr:flavin reductase [Synergistaceae bacterium]